MTLRAIAHCIVAKQYVEGGRL